MTRTTILSPDTNDLQGLLDVAVTAACTAGELVRSRINDLHAIELKEQGNYNLVTEMDHASEELVRSIVMQKVPGSKYLAEESGGERDLVDLTWVVDPIDGTVNYAHRIPMYAVSVAAVRDGAPIAGAIYGPGTDELFTATRGGGAWHNGSRLRVSDTTDLLRSVLVTGFPYNVAENPYNCIDAFVAMVRRGIPVRRLGSAALDLAYLAAGRFDAFWEVELGPWDVAAGILMVEEAGGSVVSYSDGTRSTCLVTDRILATNGHLQQDMLRILQDPMSSDS